MGGFFGAVSRRDVTMDVFFGTDYHSHLGTKNAGMTIWNREDGFHRQIHSISNSPFRTKFEKDLPDFHAGTSGFGCISDSDPQPLLVRSHLGMYAITTVGQINNAEDLISTYFSDHGHQFSVMGSGKVNSTELVAAAHQPAGQPHRRDPPHAAGHRRVDDGTADALGRQHYRRPGPLRAPACGHREERGRLLREL